MKKILLLPLLLIPACSMPRENLEITGYSPRQSLIEPSDMETLWVDFSVLPDATLAEEAFTLTADGLSVQGAFSWSGKRMFFRPYTGWKNGTDYILKISTSVETSSGHSLKTELIHAFSSREEHVRPLITDRQPAAGSAAADMRPEISMTFSEPMEPASIADAFRLVPSADGYLTWNSAKTQFTYTLKEDLKQQTDYTMNLSVEALDLQNNSLSSDWESSFSTSTESTPPGLLSVASPGAAVEVQADDPNDSILTMTPNWETDQPMILTFSESMSTESASGAVIIEPEISIEKEWNSEKTILTLQPAGIWDWDRIYTVRVTTGFTDIQGNNLPEEKLYAIRTDGPSSKPPRVAAVVLYTNPSDASEFVIPAAYTGLSLPNYATPPGSITEGNGVVDIFLSLADGAQPDILSLSENFLISGRGINSFTPLAAKQEDAAFTPPSMGTAPFGPANPGVPYDTWVRFIVYIDNNDTFAGGILTMEISGDFKDSGGRRMGGPLRIPVIMED